ncbi:hypothetical protein [Cecembia lonarensis]|uniref:Uncharacterized protein n=1 Tax=Cecembia lonarensis (strain CCUG 58316 / KCTC 22772 / LW9) TaxID=1225176 RepID=K1KYC7_CECL9|nr:hypothetical protein B879_03878 [Cecembia lonarensis LW9]
MQTEVVLPTTLLSSFVSGYFSVNVEKGDEDISLRPYESGVSLGIPLGKPFYYYAGPCYGEFEEVPFSIFDKPLMFWDSKSIDCFSVKGNAKVVFIIFTDLGLQLLLHERNPGFREMIFPFSRLGIPAFGLIVKRKLRFCNGQAAGIKIIEEELLRFFQRYQIDESHQAKIDLDTEFPFIP